jgi:hypothetical protein
VLSEKVKNKGVNDPVFMSILEDELRDDPLNVGYNVMSDQEVADYLNSSGRAEDIGLEGIIKEKHVQKAR